MVVKNTSKNKKLGDLLVEVGLLTAEQLKRAVEAQKEKGGRLGDILVELKLLSREVILSFLGKRCGVSFVVLAEYGPPAEDALALIPEPVARKQLVLPLRRRENELTVAMTAPKGAARIKPASSEPPGRSRVVLNASRGITSSGADSRGITARAATQITTRGR